MSNSQQKRSTELTIPVIHHHPVVQGAQLHSTPGTTLQEGIITTQITIPDETTASLIIGITTIGIIGITARSTNHHGTPYHDVQDFTKRHLLADMIQDVHAALHHGVPKPEQVHRAEHHHSDNGVHLNRVTPTPAAFATRRHIGKGIAQKTFFRQEGSLNKSIARPTVI